MSETVIEYKEYPQVDFKGKANLAFSDEYRQKIRKLKESPAIVHYNDGKIEWWSDFDDDDNEIHCRVSNGYECWREWKYDTELNRFVQSSIRIK